MIADSHAHLEDPRFDLDRDDTIHRAWDNYVRAVLTVHGAEDPERWPVTRKLLEDHPFVFAAVGLHPHHADDFGGTVVDHLHRCWKHPKVLAIGETGLDYYYMHSSREAQVKVFTWHINQAKVHQVPLVVHTREAHEETLDILKAEGAAEIGGMIHSFTGDADTVRRYLDLNFAVSFSGIVTFQGAREVQEAATVVPLDRLLVETDCPYLAPVPYRGRRNEPAYVLKVAEFIAKMRQLNIGDVKDAVFQNFCRLFSLDLVGDSTPHRKSA